ncbi:serine hydrolase [Caulobacter sp. NIBR2454]|uniref:serine hydrolase n=1 Tax=Caulobacter sp. NIBR2454 TaxID=3015996 RepID=UPI0022B5F8B4|nr:serine hydrolase [Caulobacter sp. NIBR2454]
MKTITAVALALISASPALAADSSPAAFTAAAERVLALSKATRAAPGASPAVAVIMVARGQKPVIHVEGVASAGAGAPVSKDTPFYIASMTKAYVGLMAAELDRRGVFDLDTTVAQVWPKTRIDGVDLTTIRMRDLLSHQGAFENEALSFRTAYSDKVPVADYGRLLDQASTPRPAGFRYDNLGYLVYAAALELKTGRSWQEHLKREVLDPLGLDHTSPRVSDFPAGASPSPHQWTTRGWRVVALKDDALMHAAGGLVSSGEDMASWLQAQIDRKGVPAASFAEAQTAQTPSHVQAVTRPGLTCTAYTLGWHDCRHGAVRVLAHGGGYTGFRSEMAFSPDLGVGIAVLTNSDSMTGALGGDLSAAFFESFDAKSPARDAKTFGEAYAASVARQAAGRDTRLAKGRADAQWAGWAWRPDAEALRDYAGVWRSPAFGDMVVSASNGGLEARLGLARLSLEPAAPDLFGAMEPSSDNPDPVRFETQADGRRALVWNKIRFERVR